MAKQVIESLVDDIDGSPADSTVAFGLDGHGYTIDLNSRHEKELRTILGPYLEAARRVRAGGRAGVRPGARPGGDKVRNAAIRAWARDEGVELATRGRIAIAVQEAFEAQDGDALREAMGVELVEPAKPRRRRTEARFSEVA